MEELAQKTQELLDLGLFESAEILVGFNLLLSELLAV